MLTKPPIEMVSATGADDESQVKVSGGTLTPSLEDASTLAEVTEGTYDDSTGILTLTFANGEELKVKGFPTLDDIPEGEQGPQGDPGEDGQDGRDGRDGNKGEPGCEGSPGVPGEQGDTGDDGRQGQPGSPGIRGCPGAQGDRGKTGATGATGPQGETGPMGETGPTGETGEQGPAGEINIVFSATDPGNVAPGTIWVNPTIDQSDDESIWP